MTSVQSIRGCWLEIHLDRLRNNLEVIRDRIPSECDLLSVVKADGYGHGAEQISQTLQQENVNHFGVATLEEGIRLRQNDIRGRILVMGHMLPESSTQLLRHDLELMVYEPEILPELQQQAESFDSTLSIHLKVDTGMGRLGILTEQVPDFLDELQQYPNLQLTGVATHFPVAGEDSDYTANQVEQFHSLGDQHPALETNQIDWHCFNTAAIFSEAGEPGDLVRPGLSLYGYTPTGSQSVAELEPIMEFKSVIADHKQVPSGFGISYGRTFTPDTELEIGVLPLGYADGYPRQLSNRASVLVEGEFRPVRGAVCMDMTVIELDPADSTEATVTLLGKSEEHSIWADELADYANTIPYEILTGFRSRIPRVYYDEDEPVAIKTHSGVNPL